MPQCALRSPWSRRRLLTSSARLSLSAAALAAVFLTAGPARSASDVCYNGGPTLANFKLNGTATLSGSSIVLTQDTGNQGGSAMYQTKFSTSNDFHIKMYVKISTTSSSTPADGMAFVMHNDPSGTSALGGLGGGVGYQNITNSVVVEFDTYYNAGTGDPTSPHIAITKQGNPLHNATVNSGLPVVTFSSLNPPLTPTNGTPFYIWVDYTASTHFLGVYVSGGTTKPATTALSATLNLTTELGSSFYVGFTGSTGGAWDKHEFVALYATDNLAAADGSCCTSDADCASSSAGAVCDPAKHVCGSCLVSNTSTCAGGSQGCDMSGSHDVCSTSCNGNNGSGATAACPSAAYPVCRTSGVGAGSCAACGGDNGTAASAPCGSGAPYCGASGYCGLCTTNSDCTAAGTTHSGSFCNSTTGKCVTTCSVDADCGSSNACLSGSCVAKAANGAAIPGGSCSVSSGSRYCASAVCSTSNNTCGYVNGSGTCTGANAATVCQSGACSSAGVCMPAAAGSCYVDADCTTGQFCARGTFTCTAKLPAGGAIPNDGLHNGTCSSATAVCATGACNATTNSCASANGSGCTAANQCVANVCGSNGKCGAANGASGCTSGNAAAYCQSATCSSTGVCVPAGGSGCYVDADCANGSFCRRDTFTCTAKLSQGAPIPADGLHGGTCSAPVAAAVCASGACNGTTNTCAVALGAACAGAADCQVNICGANGQCGFANGTGSCSGGTAATLCQSGVCSSGSVCIPAGAGHCWVDADCASGQFCSQGSLSCVAKLTAGSAIPNDPLHDGLCDAAPAVCASGLCNPTTNTCATGLGTTCSSATQCVGNICGSNGMCGTANGDGPCTTVNATTVCQSGTCGSVGMICIPAAAGSCSADAECGAGQYCDPGSLQCVAKLAAGASLPSDRLHSGVCGANIAAAVCADGACNATTNSCARATGLTCGSASQCVADVCNSDGLCGYAGGTGSCTGANATTVCASGVCSATSGVCLGSAAGSCWVDADCVSGQYCDRASATCVSQLPTGASIPTDGLHAGGCTPNNAAAVCASGSCNATTDTCSTGVGGACTGANQCNNNVCGSNGHCGYPAGAGPCAAGSAATVCQTGVCGAHSGVCIPADTGGCGTDGDCADGQFCNGMTLHCASKIASGGALPADGVHAACVNGSDAACSSSLCNAMTSTCGGPIGATCTQASECAIGICGRNGMCGLDDGETGCSTSTAALCQSGVCTSSGVCGSAGCATDRDCPNTAYCNGSLGLCKAKLGVGQTVPSDGLHDGTCTASNAQAVCSSGACNATNNTCALPNGTACTAGAQCTTGTCGSNGHCGLADGQAGCATADAATTCQSGLCSATGHRCIPMGAGRCAVDGDCTDGSFCLATTLTCTAKLAPGVALPTDGLHDGGCLPGNAAAVCASGVCNPTENTCAAPVGASCGGAAECVGDLCGSNGQCGAVAGEGPCQATDQALTCQSGTCNGAAGICQPAGDNRCVRDQDCADGSFCARATFTCATKLSAGSPIPADAIHGGACTAAVATAVCSSGACNTTSNTCGAASGESCQQPGDCANNVCAADGLCGAPDGQSCTDASSCRTGHCTAGVCGMGASPTGSGGSTGAAGNGGLAGSTGTAGGSGNTGPAAGSGSGGCNCSVEGHGRGLGGSLAVSLLMLGLVFARRRRSRTNRRG